MKRFLYENKGCLHEMGAAFSLRVGFMQEERIVPFSKAGQKRVASLTICATSTRQAGGLTVQAGRLPGNLGHAGFFEPLRRPFALLPPAIVTLAPEMAPPRFPSACCSALKDPAFSQKNAYSPANIAIRKIARSQISVLLSPALSSK
ncbi:hypothetical protein [Alkalicoccus chagannorensis]|uniref:hypothetical protein n=1 Tax=Alkalicoccus chagannorensis TaxID=427072 RepID=UPI0012EC1591|nr:hypothetical protein [Alkalicoccus chagannorensis]